MSWPRINREAAVTEMAAADTNSNPIYGDWRLGLDLRSPAEGRELARYRRAYVRIRKSARSTVLGSLKSELNEIDKKVAGLHSRIADNIERQVGFRGWFRYGVVDLESAIKIADEEFDRLERLPAVASIRTDSQEEWLHITVLEPISDHGGQRLRPNRSARQISLGLRRTQVRLDKASWHLGPLSAAALGSNSIQLLGRLLAAELMGSGELPELLDEVLPGVRDWPAAPSRVVSPVARSAYSQTRARSLMDDDLGNTLDRFQNAIRRDSRTISDLARRARVLSRSLESLQSMPEGDDDALAKEYDDLLEHPGIVRIEVGRSIVRAYTMPVVLRSRSGNRHLIGEFMVEVRPGRCVRMHNVTRNHGGPVGHCDHPHIREGRCCLGSIQSSLNRMLITDDLPALLHLSVEYLFSVNEASTFRVVEAWPMINAAGELIESRFDIEE